MYVEHVQIQYVKYIYMYIYIYIQVHVQVQCIQYTVKFDA